jgi:diguanylate cyclase (GGDEF)-like protein
VSTLTASRGALPLPAPQPTGDLRAPLRAVVSTIAATLGYGTVVANVYLPAFDAFEVMAVHGHDEVRRTLLGHRTTAEEWSPLFSERFRRGNAYLVPAGSYDWNETLAYVPPGEGDRAPDAWQPEDGLFVALRSATGEVIGVLSVDEPPSGRRPSDADIDVLEAVAAQAGLVIEAANHAAASSRHRAEVEHLLRVSRHLTGRGSQQEVLQAVCDGIAEGLGFERVALLLVEADGDMTAASWRGWREAETAGWGRWPVDALQPLLDPALEREGCVLLSSEQATALAGETQRYSSQLNGRGPRGWDHHWLLVPLRGDHDSLLGLVWADDPVDRLLPPVERLRALRAFANQAASALEAARSAERLRFLAEHDPMTGLRNRRNLNGAIERVIAEAGDAGVALLVADVDTFKRINDELGYETGDAVLRRVAAAVREACPPGGLAARLGGEEFALMLPRTDLAGARMAAEALRLAAGDEDGVPWGLTISVGLAVSGADLRHAEPLLRAATRALFAAKKLGRDRCVIYDAGTLEPLIEALGRDDRRDSHHLSAVMLLAETLDLRDAGTARHSQTVGRYAHALAAHLGFDPTRVERMGVAGILHDIGKLAVADAVLHKPGPLGDDEWAEIRRHSEVGSRILTHAGLKDIAKWVLHHHERWDGGGYPHGLDGTAIPVESRILAVADAYEAMTAARPYRTSPLDSEAAREELRRGAGTQFDPDVVATFLRVLGS